MAKDLETIGFDGTMLYFQWKYTALCLSICVSRVNSFRKWIVAMTQFDSLLCPWKKRCFFAPCWEAVNLVCWLEERAWGVWLLCLQLWKLLVLPWVPCSPGLGDLRSLKWVRSSPGKQHYKIGEKLECETMLSGEDIWDAIDGLCYCLMGYIFLLQVLSEWK